MRLIDSHAHLQADAFAGTRQGVHEDDAGKDDVFDVLAAAREAGVERLLAPGWDLASSRSSIQLAVLHPGVDASAGIHPHHASEADGQTWAAVVALAGEPQVVAVGETGLDYDRAFSPREAQLANLGRHIALAWELAKPLILHCRSSRGERDAQDDLIGELRAAGVGSGSWRDRFGSRPPALLHSFSGPVDYAEEALELGLAISFSGLVFRRGEEPSAEVARLVPGDRLLVETDSPYLSPPGAPRRRNEPRWVAVTARWLAERRAEDVDGLGEHLVANYDATFESTVSRARTSSRPD